MKGSNHTNTETPKTRGERIKRAGGPGPGERYKSKIESLEIPLLKLLPPLELARPIFEEEDYESILHSMRAVGQLQPAIVTIEGDMFRIVDGMNRFTIAKDLHWPTLRCEVYAKLDYALEAIQLHANQVHKRMTPWQEHIFFTRLCDRHKLDFEGLCRFVRRTPDYVGKRLNLANLTAESVEALKRDAISFGTSQELLRLKDPAWERYFLDLCLRTGTGSQVLHNWVSDHLQKQRRPTEAQIAAAAIPPVVPPPLPSLICQLCNGEPGGRVMTQVWVHVDELQTIIHTIQAVYGSKLQQSTPAPAPVVEVKAE